MLLLPLQEFIEQVFFVAPDNELTHQIAPDIVPDVSKIRLDTIAVPVLLISPRTRKKNRLTSAEMCVYLDVKYRLLWFRLHHPNGKIDPELIRVDEKNAIVCCRIYADKADPADQFIGKAYSQRFSTEDRFGDRFLEIAETVAKGRALADAGYGTQFCMNGDALAGIIADAPIKMPPDEDAGHPGSVVASFTAQPTADAPVFSQAATAPKSTQPAQQQVQPPVQQSHAPAPEPPKTLDEYLRVMTIEQAKAVKVDFGRFSGWSLGEIAMKSPGDLAWYVKNYSGHNLALKAGATKLLETVGQMAS